MIIETYSRCASISATAREIGTSRQVVRQWIPRYEEEGEKGLRDRSRRPHISPRKTPYHPKRLLCNRLGTPIFSLKDKRRVKDEEFYLPCILSWKDTDDLLRMAEAWQHVYNVKRPHFGKGMGGLSPLAKLQSLGYNHLDDNFSRFPVLLLDDLNPLLPGNNVLTMDKKEVSPFTTFNL